ncbi:MAG TPA: chemotaxis response regulator protein-glutamate methylesterase [Dehalococcoidia bacterium]
MNEPRQKIRVLVVDDSAFMRHTITRHLADEDCIEVVGTAKDGLDALAKVQELNPTVMTLDVEMPRLDGLATLQRLMVEHPMPVVMLSSATQEGAATTIRALELGAVDFVPKPSGSISLDLYKVKDQLVAAIRRASVSKVQPGPAARPQARRNGRGPRPAGTDLEKVVVIGCSTGGPRALQQVIPALPADIPAAILIVQHMPAGFTHSLAERLNEQSEVQVKEAQAGDVLTPGVALLAPGDYHVTVDAGGRIAVNHGPTVHGVRPSADVTMQSVVKAFGNRTVGVILTGMGTDGSLGAALIHEAGGWVIAEHASTCVVYGMPRAVVEAGAADRVVPLPRVARAILEAL